MLEVGSAGFLILQSKAGDPDLISGSGRSPGEGNGNPLQYSCLENPMNRGAWRATVHGVIRVGYDLAAEKRERERGKNLAGHFIEAALMLPIESYILSFLKFSPVLLC